MKAAVSIESKLPGVGTTIFTTMSELAVRYDAINLSQGFPNFDCDDELKDLVYQNIRRGRNQYAPMPGVLTLRTAIAEKLQLTCGVDINPYKEITVTAGATQALFAAIGSVIRKGDHAVIFDPAYDAYAPAVKCFGGKVSAIALRAPAFTIDWQEVEQHIRSNTRLIVINTPHNPLGKILKQHDLQQLSRIAESHDLIVLSDEVYEHLVYDGQEHESVLKHPELFNRTFAVYSFGKVFHVTGWKVGYCVAPDHLMKEFRKVHQFAAFAANTPMQHALAAYLLKPDKYLELPAFFQKKRDYFASLMARSRFRMLPCEGSYFMLADYSDISDSEDMDFARWLTAECGVATIPLSPFYHSPPEQRILRFCFAKTDETLKRAADKLRGI